MAKTPVSLLKDYCIDYDCNPEYEEIDMQGPSHDPTFELAVRVGSLCGELSSYSTSMKYILQLIEFCVDYDPNLKVIF